MGTDLLLNGLRHHRHRHRKQEKRGRYAREVDRVANQSLRFAFIKGPRYVGGSVDQTADKRHHTEVCRKSYDRRSGIPWWFAIFSSVTAKWGRSKGNVIAQEMGRGDGKRVGF